MRIALIMVSFLLFIVALIVMPKRIYERFQNKAFSRFWKGIALVLADMFLFGIFFAAAMAESGELLLGVFLSLDLLLGFTVCFLGVMLMEAFQKKASLKQKMVLSILAAIFLIMAVLLYVFILR